MTNGISHVTNWLKKYWLKTLISIITIILTSYLSSLATKIVYKKQIKASDDKITEIKQDMKDSDSRADAAIVRARTAEQEARVERQEKERHKANVARIEKEKQGLKDRIAALPPTQIVVHTIEILSVEPTEITLQPQGVVFTLAATRKNLEFLKTFTLVKKQYSELTLSFVKSEKEGIKLLEANTEMKMAIVEKDSQLVGWEKAEIEWYSKFNLSEKRRKGSWWKGAKTGGIVGGVIAFFAGFFLGGK